MNIDDRSTRDDCGEQNHHDIQKQNFYALDLELNQPSGKIIQVGIAIGNMTEGVIERRAWYLDPVEPIDEFITQLTGIEQHNIDTESVTYATLAQELGDAITQHKCVTNPVQWGHGDGNALRNEFRLQGIQFKHMGHRDIDVKQVYSYLAIAQGKNPKGGLATALGRNKLHFQGTHHQAHWDAHNTLRLYLHLLRRQINIEAVIGTIKGM